jgi:hypothetical protein
MIGEKVKEEEYNYMVPTIGIRLTASEVGKSLLQDGNKHKCETVKKLYQRVETSQSWRYRG